MKNSIQDSFKLLLLLKQFVLDRGQSHKLYLPVMHNNHIISQFIRNNNHLISSNIVLSNLLGKLLDNAAYDLKIARRN